MEEVIYCSARRCLCYPLYRHWQLVQCVLHDTTQLFLLGNVYIALFLIYGGTVYRDGQVIYT